jgi:predicted porin
VKKSVLAAAAIAASSLSPVALAQGVTFNGLVDVFAGSMQYAGERSTAMVGSGGMTTSWWGLGGTEDLGGGLKAEFKLTSFFRPDIGAYGRFTGDTMFSRDAWVGLTGAFGTVHAGRDLAPNFLPTVAFNAFGDSFVFSPLVLHTDVPLFNATGWNAANAADTGWSNEIVYTTPDIGGFKANLHYQFGEVIGQNGKHNAGLNFMYFNGPFALGGFYHDVQVNNPTGGALAHEQKAWMLSGKAGFGSANVYANYEQADNDGADDSKTWSVSGDMKAGPGKVLAAYAGTKWSVSDVKRDTFSLGYDYEFSKRTDVYAVYMYDKVSNFDGGTSFGVGIRHRF